MSEQPPAGPYQPPTSSDRSGTDTLPYPCAAVAAGQHRKRHVFITSAAVLVSLLVSAGLSGCGGTSTTATHSSAPRATSDATAVRTYPDERADAALCKTYNADISSGDTYDAGTALGAAAAQCLRSLRKISRQLSTAALCSRTCGPR